MKNLFSTILIVALIAIASSTTLKNRLRKTEVAESSETKFDVVCPPYCYVSAIPKKDIKKINDN